MKKHYPYDYIQDQYIFNSSSDSSHKYSNIKINNIAYIYIMYVLYLSQNILTQKTSTNFINQIGERSHIKVC